MMLCKLSVKNIRKSIRDYAIYFFTLVLGVAIFYVFNAIESQTVMVKVSQNTMELIALLNNTLSGVSVVVSLILGFLIIYASRFLMKRRSSEFAIYLTLGMGKGQVSLILFLETLFIGVVSLAVGLLVGIGLSQLMSIFVVNMFEADMTQFAFTFSAKALGKSCLYFGIIYLVVIVFQTLSVGRYQLIDLMQAHRRSEKVKMKNPWFCAVVFTVSAAVLGYAYYMVTDAIALGNMTADQIDIPIVMGCLGTFFLIWSLSGFLLRVVMSMKGVYYRGLNSFTLRQISSKVNTTVFSMTLICLMLFVTICVMSSCLFMRNSMTSDLDELAPADLQLKAYVNMDESFLAQGYTQEQIDHSGLSIIERLDIMGIDLKDDLKESVSFYVYRQPDLTLGTMLGETLDGIMKQYKFLSYETPEDIVRISDYNRAAELYGKKTYTLEEDQYLIVADFDSMVAIRNESLAAGTQLNINGRVLSPKFDQCQDGFLEMSSNHVNSGVIVVPDSVPDDSMARVEYLIANYKASSKEQKQQIDEKLNQFDQAAAAGVAAPEGATRLSIAEMSIGLGAMVTFIGLYLGIIFLISSAALLALKELSESADNKERFQMLRKLGVDDGMVNRALFAQIGIFFFCPLALAVIHSVFGLKFCMLVLEALGNEGIVPSVLATSVIIVVIYGGYFLLTYLCSKQMIWEKR